MPAAVPTDIHLFEDGARWVVAVDGAHETFDSRPAAFDRAKTLARQHSPSKLVKTPPTLWPPPTVPPASAAALPTSPPAILPESVDADESTDPDDPFYGLSTTRPDPSAAGVAADPGWLASIGPGSDDDAAGSGPPAIHRGSPAGRPAPSTPTATSTATRRPPPPAERRTTVYDNAVRVRPERPPATLADWARLAGPPALGRSLLLHPGDAAPEPWAGRDRVALTAEHLGDPDLLRQVRAAFFGRVPVIYEIEVDIAPPAAGSIDIDAWRVPVDFDFGAEAVWSLATLNAVDGRGPGGPTFAPADGAIALGASAGDDLGTDVVLSDGRPAWCDGGPLHVWAPGELPAVGGQPDVVVIPRLCLEHDHLRPLGTDGPGADLAPDQLAAVAESGPRARIIAPAGSGKTRVLTERARHLLRADLPASALCLVAFNKRAQIEMQDRTPDLPGLRVQTLNALALAILNGSGSFLSRGAPVRTIDELAVRRLLGDLVKFPRRANTDPAAAWIDALSSVRLGLRSPDEVEREYNGDVDGFAEFFPKYRRALRTSGSVDFDEQIYLALEALLTEPDTRRQAQRQARVLLVDEFQDLTPAHMLLIRLLAGAELGIFGVGDDDQTIYGYSGASPDWLVHFDRFIPLAGHHALEVNYRCPEPVVKAATNLLSRNELRVTKTILTGPKNVRSADALAVVHHELPVLAAVDVIKEHLANGAQPSDIAVLTRVNTLLAPIQAALHAEGIAVMNRDGARFLERTGVAAALSWLRLAVRPDRLASEDIQRAARRPSRGLSPKVAEWMGDQRQIAALERLAGRMTNEKDGAKIIGFARDIERIGRLATTAPTAEIIEFVRNEIGLDRAMQTLDSAHRGRNAAAHSDDLRALIALGRLHPDPKTFFAWLHEALSAGSVDHGVQLSTVHKVKGLEWPHVIVYDATDGVFPHRLSTDVEEERRVFHVAITRCQRTLHIVADVEKPSVFLRELDQPGHPQVRSPPTPGSGAAATGLFAPSSGSARRTVPEVVAVVGLELSWGGYDCTVAAVEADSVTLLAGRASMTVAFGSQISLLGKPRTLVAPSAKQVRATQADTPHDNPAVLDALKTWRSARAKTDAVPAYVVAPDKTLNEIASVLPTSLDDLLRISGIGPAKLDRYGDEILAVLEDATTVAG